MPTPQVLLGQLWAISDQPVPNRQLSTESSQGRDRVTAKSREFSLSPEARKDGPTGSKTLDKADANLRQ